MEFARSQLEAYYTVRAVCRWLELNGVEAADATDVGERLEASGVSKQALRGLTKRLLSREYRVAEDGSAIAGLMTEAEIPWIRLLHRETQIVGDLADAFRVLEEDRVRDAVQAIPAEWATDGAKERVIAELRRRQPIISGWYHRWGRGISATLRPGAAAQLRP